MSDGALLRIDGLTRRFGGLVAVDGMALSVSPGEIVGLLGPNGSGKTTVLNLVSGALHPQSGRIVLRGREIQGLPPYRIARLGIARTFQLTRTMAGMDCRENVLAGLAFGRRGAWGPATGRDIDVLLERVGLGGRGAVPASQLTYIDQKRLELARALAMQPDLLLLDEWLAGLTPTELLQAIELVRALRSEGIAIVLVEHVMDAVRSLCSRCVVMNAGRRIAEGSPADVLADPEVVRAYLGDGDA